jgi:AcrR family transcriptional regulator
VATAPEPMNRPAEFPTRRGRRTQAAIDAAARTVIARKGILATTIADIAAEAGRYRAIYGKEA